MLRSIPLFSLPLEGGKPGRTGSPTPQWTAAFVKRGIQTAPLNPSLCIPPFCQRYSGVQTPRDTAFRSPAPVMRIQSYFSRQMTARRGRGRSLCNCHQVGSDQQCHRAIHDTRENYAFPARKLPFEGRRHPARQDGRFLEFKEFIFGMPLPSSVFPTSSIGSERFPAT